MKHEKIRVMYVADYVSFGPINNFFEMIENGSITSWIVFGHETVWGCDKPRFPLFVYLTYMKAFDIWNVCQVYSVEYVCLRLRYFSQLYFMQYMGLCVFSSPFSVVMIVRIFHLIIIIKLEV